MRRRVVDGLAPGGPGRWWVSLIAPKSGSAVLRQVGVWALLLLLAISAAGCLGFRRQSTASSVRTSVGRGLVDLTQVQSELACSNNACSAIISTARNNAYAYWAGTSLATPYVSAAAGVLKASGVNDPDEIEAILKNHARPLGRGSGDQYYGSGLLDIEAALNGNAGHTPLSISQSIASLQSASGMVSAGRAAPAVSPTEAAPAETRLIVDITTQLETAFLAEISRLGLSARREGRVWVIEGWGDMSAVATRLLQQGLAKSAEVAAVWHALGSVSDDPYSYQQWGLNYSRFPAIWSVNLPLSQVTIAVLDTGVQMDHPDFAGVPFVQGCSMVTAQNSLPRNYQPSQEFAHGSASSQYCWDTNPIDLHAEVPGGHGTAVTGVIAAVRDNKKGIAGAWDGFSIMPVRVLNAEGQGSEIGIAYGIYYAVDNDADVINLSLGGYAGDSMHPEMKKAIDYARSQGVVVVAAAGNNYAARLSPPASYDPVISVGAVSIWGTRAAYSNYGTGLDLVAPGGAGAANLVPTVFAVRTSADAAGITSAAATATTLPVAAYASIDSSGQFSFSLPAGVFRFYAWIDANLNGLLDADDYLAETSPQLMRAGGELTGLFLKLAKYTGHTVTVY